MVINNNNSHINSFVKGMNSDSAYDQIENTQYVFGKNIRITKNQSLGGSADYSSVHEGIVSPVLNGVLAGSHEFSKMYGYRILYINTIDNLGVAIMNQEGSENIQVYRFEIDPEANTITKDFELIWTYDNLWKNSVPDKVSAVLYKELDNVIKLYIADGEHPIITLRVDDDGVDQYKEYTKDQQTGISNMNMDPDDLMNNRIMPQERVYIDGIITGRLITSQVQYTYRYYNKYGNSSQLAPLTNKIQVIDSSRSKEIGNAENTETSVGFALNIDTSDYNKRFNRIQVFRLSYIKPGEDAEVALIYDDKFDTTSSKFILNDVGIDPLQQYTMEEFSAMQGLILIPQTIEQNQEYLFCANVKDDTILKELKVVKGNYTKPVYTEITLTNTTGGTIPDPGKEFFTNDNKIKEWRNSQEEGDVVMTVPEYFKQHGISPEDSHNNNIIAANYNNIFTSSLLRSLRREETYKYAIVFYDKYGRRSDVQPIEASGGTMIHGADIQKHFFKTQSGKVQALPVGVKIKIPRIEDGFDLSTIVGCQIVRRNSSDIYQNTLLQVALARPVQQGLLDRHIDDVQTITDDTVVKSPFYPSGLLATNDISIWPSYYSNYYMSIKEPTFAKTKNKRLFQIFSSEIDFRRDDVLSRLSSSDLNIIPLFWVDSYYKGYTNSTPLNNRTLYSKSSGNSAVSIGSGNLSIDRQLVEKLTVDQKQARHWVFNFYNDEVLARTQKGINAVKDVKIADWKSEYTDIIKNDSNDIRTAIKKYRSYTTNIDSYIYNNWVAFGKYDFRPGLDQEPNQEWDDDIHEAQDMLDHHGFYNTWITTEDWKRQARNGFAGPGPSCFLISTDNDVTTYGTDKIQTMICNITHTPKTSNVQSEQTEQYFGFGNYFPLEYNEANRRLEVKGTGKTEMVVFDGDIYITPHEFTTQFKTYNFESFDTLQSTQVTNYIPLESKVNTYFDYGMNLMNTQSENLLYEPGSIDGVTTQERPLHQYNMIYSDNDASNDVFTLISTDKNETNNFKQRAYYSELKSNGEFIDNFLIFKAASFIDVDSKYGEITNMLTDKNTLYYWQDQAFGKFSVNERSLVNDQNSNTIMLGQAGILSRYDYMSTKYGMRLHDFCAKTTENGLFWVDINNKAIVGVVNGQVVNYGEHTGVQNIINQNITTDVPYVDYDLQNNELLCKCFGDDQLVFNVKYGIATAVYNRIYRALFCIKNHLYSISNIQADPTFYITKLNYIKHDNSRSYLTPVQLEFIVNPSASVTKVFDSQQIVPIKMSDNGSSTFTDRLSMSFQTDIYSRDQYDVDSYTDREGNIIYNVPRYNNEEYGSRIRGKWMKVGIKKEKPDDLFTISHVITKFRQSFS